MSGVNAVGRPRVITEAEVVRLEHKIKRGYGVAVACRYAGIGRTTYYAELERSQEFANRMRHAKLWLGMQAKIVVANDILLKRNTKTARWFLEHRSATYA